MRRERQHETLCVGLSRGFGMGSSIITTVSWKCEISARKPFSGFLLWLLVTENVALKERNFVRI